MSLDISKINYPVKEKLKTIIEVPDDHFLIKLNEVIPWSEYADLAIADLYKERKRSGKKLNLRLHLGAFILQSLFRWTDRSHRLRLGHCLRTMQSGTQLSISPDHA
jgi:hypothetical protein